MSDEPKDTDVSASELEKIQAERDALTKRLEEAERRAAEADSKMREAIESRQKAKERERKELEQKGEHEKLIAEIRAENEEQAAKLAQYETERTELLAAKEAYDKAREEQRAELIARLPEDKREEAKAHTLEQLKFAVSLLPVNGTPPATHKGGGSAANGAGNLKWSEMSRDLRDAFIRSHTPLELADKIAAG